MPYIEQSKRRLLNPDASPAETPGELNYQLSCLLGVYIAWNGLNYGHINDVLGALEGAKLEFYRRVAVPYEQGKIEDNGDLYDWVQNLSEGR